MKKRNRNGTLVSRKNSPKQFIQMDLPHELWLNVAEFLNKPGLATLSFLNKNLAVVAWQTMIRVYQKRFVCFPFAFHHENPAYDIELLRQLNRGSQFYYTQYYTLFDPAYIELFQAIEIKDCQKAINFINRQLSLNQHNVVDRVFYQKNGEGETVITLAGRYQLQDFLNFCFNILIKKGYQFNQGRHSLVKTGDYSAVLASLDFNMSNQALWLYACAYVCNQNEVCQAILQKAAWRKTWIDDNQREPLAVIAILLSSLNLMQCVLNDLGRPQIEKQLGVYVSYEPYELYITNRGDDWVAEDIAAFGKNRAIIDYLVRSILAKADEPNSPNLLAYFIECRDIRRFKAFYNIKIASSRSDLLNQYLCINSKEYLSILGVAVAKNWLEAVKFMVTPDVVQRSQTNYRTLSELIYLTIELDRVEILKYFLSIKIGLGFSFDLSTHAFLAAKKNNLKLVKLLVENKASLEKKDECYTYPLISAVLHENKEMTQYIVQKLGSNQAQYQLQSSLTFYENLNFTLLCEKIEKYKRERRLITAALNNFSLYATQPDYQVRERKYETRNSVTWLRLPPPLWIGIGIFLAEKDLLHLLQIRFTFAFDLLERILYSRQEGIHLPFSVYEITDFCRTLYHTYALFHHRWYTLFDYDYIQLFRLVEQRDFVLAQEFIRSRQNHPDLIDMIFYQKDGNGETVITLANRLGFQKFLDYCFKIFALSSTRNRPYSLVKLGNYTEALSRLNAGTMSDEIFWIFTCAYICNQWNVWKTLLANPHWNMNAYTSQGDQSIVEVASMLSSITLLNFIFPQFCEDSSNARYFKPFELYTNKEGIYLDLNDIINISKNRALIKRLNDFDNGENQDDLELIFFYIENKDLNKLHECYREIQEKKDDMKNYNTTSRFPNTFFRSQSQLPLTPLGFAIVQNWMAGVQCILNYNPGILNEKLPLIPSPLSIAVKLNRVEIIKYLLSHGASPHNAPDDNYRPPIFDAIDNSNLEIVKLLVVHGAGLQRIFLKEYNIFISPLTYAMINTNDSIVNYLTALSRTASLTASSLTPQFVISHQFEQYPKIEHWLKLLKSFLLDSFFEMTPELKTPTPLLAAIAFNYFPGVQCLVELGAVAINKEIDELGNPLINPLNLAVHLGFTKIVQYLLSKGAKPDGFEKQRLGQPAPIFYAVKNNNLELVELLIRHGSHSYIENKQNALHRYPLVSAILYRHKQIMECIIKHLGLAAAIEQVREVCESKLVSINEKALLKNAYDRLKNNYYQVFPLFNSHIGKKNINGGSSLMLNSRR